jgi:hypothetical protein
VEDEEEGGPTGARQCVVVCRNALASTGAESIYLLLAGLCGILSAICCIYMPYQLLML